MNAMTRTTSAMSIVSLVSGILGWTLLPFLGSIVAVITGHMARGEIRRAPDRLEGDGLAIAGLILGYAAIAMAVFAVVAIFLFFGGLAWFLAMSGN
ncbi:MAG: DUF4190 domain-containing protein [Thermomonas sp.]